MTGPAVVIPSEFSGRARVVGCPWCRARLMLVLDESGRGTMPLEVRSWDLAPGPPGVWNLRGGWIHAEAHRCGPSAEGPGPVRPP